MMFWNNLLHASKYLNNLFYLYNMRTSDRNRNSRVFNRSCCRVFINEIRGSVGHGFELLKHWLVTITVDTCFTLVPCYGLDVVSFDVCSGQNCDGCGPDTVIGERRIYLCSFCHLTEQLVERVVANSACRIPNVIRGLVKFLTWSSLFLKKAARLR